MQKAFVAMRSSGSVVKGECSWTAGEAKGRSWTFVRWQPLASTWRQLEARKTFGLPAKRKAVQKLFHLLSPCWSSRSEFGSKRDKLCTKKTFLKKVFEQDDENFLWRWKIFNGTKHHFSLWKGRLSFEKEYKHRFIVLKCTSIAFLHYLFTLWPSFKHLPCPVKAQTTAS